MNEAEFAQLSEVLKFVWENPYSDFYIKKYLSAGFDPIRDFKEPNDIVKIPSLSRKELSDIDPDKRLYYSTSSLSQVFSTSGSSHQKPALIYRRQISRKSDTHKYIQIRGSKRLLSLHPPARIRVPDLVRASVFLVGDIANLNATAYQAASINIDSIYSSPTLLINFSSYLNKYFDLKKIKFILCGGELMSLAKVNLLRTLFPDAIIESRYSLIEAGLIGLSCKDSNQLANTYHLYSNIYPEIVGENNELLITHLFGYKKFGTPLIRYATGDSVVFGPESCACDRKGRLFKVEGKANFDFIRTGGGMISAVELEDILAKVGAVRDFLLHVYEVSEKNYLKSKLLLEVVKENEQFSVVNLKEILLERLNVGANIKLGGAIEKGHFLPLEIQFVSEIKRPGVKKLHILTHFQDQT